MTRLARGALVGALLLFCATPECSSDSPEASNGKGGKGGSSGSAATGGSAGIGGSVPDASAGTAGDAGTTSGTGGEAGTSAGSAGMGGTEDASDADAGCTPTKDNCPLGQYCVSDSTCVPGCKDAASCASGVCSAAHDCTPCLSDAECAQGRVCSSGVCAPACADQASSTDCSGGFKCCALRCSDTVHDVKHCGACGTSCQSDEFCGKSGCADATIANLCQNTKIAGILDGAATDESAVGTLIGALAACITTTRTLPQATADVINTSTGRPLAIGGELVVTAGGDFAQKLVNYVEEKRIAPVYPLSSATDHTLRARGTDVVIASLPRSQTGPAHDLLLIEVVRDPDTGTLALVVYGFNPSGTTAGAWFFANVMFPARATYDQAFYVYEWTDTGTVGPSSADEFVRKLPP